MQPEQSTLEALRKLREEWIAGYPAVAGQPDLDLLGYIIQLAEAAEGVPRSYLDESAVDALRAALDAEIPGLSDA